MTRNEYQTQTVYDELRAYDGLELNGNSAVTGSIASVLEHGEVLNDTGNQYDSIQTAIDAASAWVFIGPGTYYESITAVGSDISIMGSGYGTVIDGNTVDPVFEAGSNTEVSHIRFENGGTHLNLTDNNHVHHCHFENSGGDGINMTGRENRVIANNLQNIVDNGIKVLTSGGANIISQNYVDTTTSLQGIICNESDDNIISNNIVRNADLNGIYLRFNANDNIVSGNRVHNSGQTGVDVTNNADDNIVSNNRISDSGTSDITNGGTGTVLDGNLTGASN